MLILNLDKSFPVTLVSSAAIKSTSFNILIALEDMSSKFPIGVHTINNFDFSIGYFTAFDIASRTGSCLSLPL